MKSQRGMSIAEILVVNALVLISIGAVMSLYNTQLKQLKFLEDKFNVLNHQTYIASVLSNNTSCVRSLGSVDPTNASANQVRVISREDLNANVTDIINLDDNDLRFVPGTNLEITDIRVELNDRTVGDPNDYHLYLKVEDSNNANEVLLGNRANNRTPIKPMSIPLIVTLDGNNEITDCGAVGVGGGGNFAAAGGGAGLPPGESAPYGGTYEACQPTGENRCPCAADRSRRGCVGGPGGSGIEDCWQPNSVTGACSCPDGFSPRMVGQIYHYAGPRDYPDGNVFICTQ